MGAMASQIASVSILYSTVCSGTNQRKHQSPASLAFLRGVRRWPVDPPHKGPVTRKMYPFYDVIIIYRQLSWEGTQCCYQYIISYIRACLTPSLLHRKLPPSEMYPKIMEIKTRSNLTMMTSSNGNIFRVSGPLRGEFTGHRWIPPTKASDAELWCFLWFTFEEMVEQTNQAPVILDAIALIMTSLLWQTFLGSDFHLSVRRYVTMSI